MDIKNKPTLEEKQAFWAEQLPNFEAKYWLPSHFEFVVFDMNQGNYVIKDGLDSDLEDDATEVYHRVNTGWAMWKKAINFTKAQAVPYESCSTKSHEIIINETKNELINGYDIAKEDEYLLESLVYRGVCIGKAQAVPEGFVLVPKDMPLHILKIGQSYLTSDCLCLDLENAYKAMIEAQEQS